MNTNLTSTELNTTQNHDADVIEGTGWTWAEAASMAKECAREDRLFGRRNRTTRRQSGRKMSMRSAASFLKATGMTIETAAAMAKDSMRERRLFGSPLMYAAS